MTSGLEGLLAAQGDSQFQAIYESLSPLQSPEDGGTNGDTTTGGNDSAAEKLLKKATNDVAGIGVLLTPQTSPTPALRLPSLAGMSFQPADGTEVDTVQEDSPLPISTEDQSDPLSSHAVRLPQDLSSAMSMPVTYPPAYYEAGPNAGPAAPTAESSARTSQKQMALSPALQFEMKPDAATSPAPSPLTPSAANLAHENDSRHFNSVPQLGTPMDTHESDGPSSNNPNSQTTLLTRDSKGSWSNRLPASPKAPDETEKATQAPQTARGVVASAAISTPDRPEIPAPTQNAKRPGLPASRAVARSVIDGQSISPTLDGTTIKPKTDDGSTYQPVAPARHPREPQHLPLSIGDGQLPTALAAGVALQVAASVEPLATDQPKQADRTSARPSSDTGNAIVAQTLSKIPFAARAENLAFTLHLQESKPAPPRPQPNTPAPPVRNQVTSAVKNELRMSPSAPATPPREIISADVLKRVPSQEVQPVWNEAPTIIHTDISAPAPTPSRVNTPVAAQELQQVPPEPTKPAANSEIQLHLTTTDQSSASIRVTDRAGAVNISVHASDPQVRNSLRSNLSELSTQLNTQGWKTEVLKAAPVATRSDSGQDAPSGGNNSSSQQRYSDEGARQPRRDQQSNNGYWQDEFEEQTTGNDSNRGGNR